jgi:hypothetical protein
MKMKKIIVLFIAITATLHSQAQEPINPIMDHDFMRDLLQSIAIILVVVFISSFILSMIKMFLDSRLKNKLIDKGASETIVSQLLQPFEKENKNINIKWFSVFAGIGLGLALIGEFQPLGIHSLAIMSFCLAASFLGYHLFTRKSEK